MLGAISKVLALGRFYWFWFALALLLLDLDLSFLI
jgi:hypothetical protein